MTCGDAKRQRTAPSDSFSTWAVVAPNSSNKVNFRNVGLTFPQTKACAGGCHTGRRKDAGRKWKTNGWNGPERGGAEESRDVSWKSAFLWPVFVRSFVRCFYSRLQDSSPLPRISQGSIAYPCKIQKKKKKERKLTLVLVNTRVFSERTNKYSVSLTECRNLITIKFQVSIPNLKFFPLTRLFASRRRLQEGGHAALWRGSMTKNGEWRRAEKGEVEKREDSSPPFALHVNPFPTLEVITARYIACSAGSRREIQLVSLSRHD